MSRKPDEGRPLRVVLVEDEPLARQRMRHMLDDAAVLILAEAADAQAAVDAIETHHPDVVILDVQLPGSSGFDVIEAFGVDLMPPVIFVTAHDEYALRAFEVQALDYLLKPVEAGRLADALARVRARLRHVNVERLQQALHAVRAQATPERLAVRDKGRIRFVNVGDIDYVVAEGNYGRLCTREGSYLLRMTMAAMEERFTRHGFLRIHRGILVQADRITELRSLSHGEYAVLLKDGQRLESGRSYRERIRKALALSS